MLLAGVFCGIMLLSDDSMDVFKMLTRWLSFLRGLASDWPVPGRLKSGLVFFARLVDITLRELSSAFSPAYLTSACRGVRSGLAQRTLILRPHD